jgi:hypothetical protein
MRARVRRRPAYDVCWECQRCLRRRYFRFGSERACPCGATTGTIVFGRYESVNVQPSVVETAPRVVVPKRRMRARLARRKDDVAKLKIVKRTTAEAAPKTAQAGPARTGAKVVKTKEGKGPATTGRFLGVTTGLSVTKFQNDTIARNAKAKLTDAQLAALWKKEFPNAKADYTESTVRGVRGLFNKGKHGNDAPAKPVPEFDAAGQALPFRGEKSAAKAAKAAAAPAKKSAVPAAPVKKLKKVVK